MVSRCICYPFEILKWQRMAGTQEFLCSQAPGWSKLSSTQVCRHQWRWYEGEMLHSCLCLPSPSSIPESIPVGKEKLKKDFAAVQGACSSTLGALGQSCLHQPWGEQPRRSHSRPGQALPSRTDQLCVLRMQLFSFPPPSQFPIPPRIMPFPILPLLRAHPVPEWYNSSGPMVQESSKSF